MINHVRNVNSSLESRPGLVNNYERPPVCVPDVVHISISQVSVTNIQGYGLIKHFGM